MTKLEQKLIELGYEHCECFRWYYRKDINNEFRITFQLNCEFNQIEEEESFVEGCVSSREELDRFNQAFDMFQKDLEVLKNEL